MDSSQQHTPSSNQQAGLQVSPDFTDLQAPETYHQHFSELASQPRARSNSEILDALLAQLRQVNFKLIAFPELQELQAQKQEIEAQLASTTVPGSDVEAKEWSERPKGEEAKKLEQQAEKLQKQINACSVGQRHFLVLSVSEILKSAREQGWQLCKNKEHLYLYNGCYWALIDKEALAVFLGEAAERLGVDKFYAQFYEFRDKLWKQFLAKAYLPAPEPNRNEVLINLQNGTFEITPQGNRLRPFDSADFITYQLPFSYNPEAQAPRWEAFLNKVLPDVERQKVLAEFLGFVFMKNRSGAIKEERALILYGTGANGKSVVFEVVSAILGRENVSNFSPQSLTEEKGFYRAKIANKLLNYASEVNVKLEPSKFKSLVSGEGIEVCEKYGQPYTMEDYARFIFNCNELPKDVEQTNAYFRRFLIIPFDVTIPESEQDKNLHSKIIESELAGVFNWILQGLERLLKQGQFSECEAAKQALEAYKLESNSVLMFLQDNGIEASTESQELIADIYPSYKLYCADEGMPPFKKRNFVKQLRAAGITVQAGTGNRRYAHVERKDSGYAI